MGKTIHCPRTKDSDYEIVGVVGDTLFQWCAVMATMYFPMLVGDIDNGKSLRDSH